MSYKKVCITVLFMSGSCIAMLKPLAIPVAPAATVKEVLNAHSAAINTISISANDKYALTTSDDKTALLWDLSGQSATYQNLVAIRRKLYRERLALIAPMLRLVTRAEKCSYGILPPSRLH